MSTRDRLLTGNLTYLMALEANGLDRAAGQLVDKIARGMGRTPIPLARRKADEYRRAKALNAPLEQPEIGPTLERDLKALERAQGEALLARAEADVAREGGDNKAHKLALAKLKTAQGKIRVLRRDIDAARNAQIDRRWAEQATAETLTLDKVRGDESEEEDTEVPEWVRDPESGGLLKGDDGLPVLRVERATTRRALSRSGLDLAFVRGDLGEGTQTPMRLREIGRRYAAAYEAAAARLTPEANEVRGTGVPEPQLSTLMAWLDLAIMRGERELEGVELRRLSPKQRGVLDRVCGLGLTIGASAREMRAGVPSVRRALRAGLETAGENLKAVSKAKRPQQKAAA